MQRRHQRRLQSRTRKNKRPHCPIWRLDIRPRKLRSARQCKKRKRENLCAVDACTRRPQLSPEGSVARPIRLAGVVLWTCFQSNGTCFQSNGTKTLALISEPKVAVLPRKANEP